ncbi:MAG: dihydrolipoyl dehydrogenase [Paracoccaceae bacterium]
MQKFDVFVLGGGPGGYVAAIRASQLGLKVGLVEKENLGGVCLNWGCIPTKALIKSAEVFSLVNNANLFGVSVKDVDIDILAVVKRSRKIAEKLSGGVKYLLQKNKVSTFKGIGSLFNSNIVKIESNGSTEKVFAENIIVATGARSKIVKGLEPDSDKIWTYKDALVPAEIPQKMLIVGAGVIGIEFAYFYRSLGTDVTVVDLENSILSSLDSEIRSIAKKEFERQGIKFILNSKVTNIKKTEKSVEVSVFSENSTKIIRVNKVLSAIGVVANIENLNLEECGVTVENGIIVVNEFCRSSVDNIFCIGDVVRGPWLAHKASHEGIVVAEKIAGKNPKALNDKLIPACIYSNPQISSIGLTECEAKKKYEEISVGKFPYSANGKALTEGKETGLIKTIFHKKTGELLGAHMIGAEVTELIQGFSIGMNLETTEEELINTIYPHPTLSEMLGESVLNAFGKELHV